MEDSWLKQEISTSQGRMRTYSKSMHQQLPVISRHFVRRSASSLQVGRVFGEQRVLWICRTTFSMISLNVLMGFTYPPLPLPSGFPEPSFHSSHYPVNSGRLFRQTLRRSYSISHEEFYNHKKQMQTSSPYNEIALNTHSIEPPFQAILGRLICEELISVETIFDIIDQINADKQKGQDAIVVFQEIFRHQSSCRILYAVEIFEYLAKNCNMNLYIAANTQSFADSLLGLLRRVLIDLTKLRGKFNFLERIARNIKNWIKIEAKVLYFIQLWYDAFIMSEDELPNLVGLYRILKKQNITFPPRERQQRNMIAVQTKSPIFDNLAVIVQSDREEFDKKKRAIEILETEDRITQQYKFNCLQTATQIQSNKILVPHFSQPYKPLSLEKISILIEKSKNSASDEANQACKQLHNFLQNQQEGFHQQRSMRREQLRNQAQELVKKWKFHQNIKKQSTINTKEKCDIIFFDIQ